MSSWPASNLHDAQLVRVTLDWSAGTAHLELIPHQSYPDQPGAIEARKLQQAAFPRRQDWGPSNSVLEAHAPEPTPEGGALRLVITMQSGDELVLVADEFTLLA